MNAPTPSLAPSLGYARVIKTPEGKAPLNARQAWVDLILPIAAVIGAEDLTMTCGQTIDCDGVAVNFEAGLAVLANVDPNAAACIRETTTNPDPVLIFRVDEVEFLDGQKRKPTPLPIHQRFGMLEAGVGAHDHPENIRII